MNTINRYIRLSVQDCKRMGYLQRDTIADGVIKWTQGKTVVASVGITTVTTAGEVPRAVLRYTYRGTDVEIHLTLRYKVSNLNNGSGFYYFVCPVTGLCCRNLYLVGGKFVSRQAFRPLYASQTVTQSARSGFRGFLSVMDKLERMETDKYRRHTYNGKLTPYGRKYERLSARADAIAGGISLNSPADFWAAV